MKAPPGFPKLVRNETPADKAAADGWGQPNYDGLKTLYVPSHFPGYSFPRVGFGFTELSPEGPKYRGGPYR